MTRCFMTRSFGVVVGLAVVLAGGLVLIHRASAPPASETQSPRVPVPPPQEAPPAPRVLAAEEAPAPVAVGRSDTTAQAPLQELVALRKEVALLRRAVAAVQRQRPAARQAASGVAAEKEDSAVPDPRTEQATRAAADRARHQQIAEVEANFRHEPTDPQWAATAGEAVQAALASTDTLQDLLLGLDCHTHTCRVELAQDDTGELEKGLPLVLMQLAPTLPSGRANYVEAGAGGKTMILYLSREAPEPPLTGK
jgi:hypothetical protein